MSYSKPTIDTDAILTLLRQQFADDITRLESIQSGHVAQTYSFAVREKDFIIRFNTSSEAFEKDAYAYNNFSTADIPIPRIVNIGAINGLYYAISKKLPGTMVNYMTDAEFRKVIPSLMEVLDHIHHVDVRDQQNYGYMNARGVGQHTSWHEHITSIIEEDPADFFGRWHTLFQDSFLEKSVFDTIYQKMIDLLDYCPEERYLLHGDYGFDNVLAYEGKVTAVLDWALSQYGDFLYDVAYLNYFAFQYNFQEYFRQFYASKGVSVPYYNERMRCYTCYIGLSAMRFFASMQLEREYVWARTRVLSLVTDSSSQKE